MPRKVRELIADLKRAGFVERAGKGSHRVFVHPKSRKRLTVAGNLGEDARDYQIKLVADALGKVRQ